MDAIFQEQHALALRHEKKRQDIRARLAANRRREAAAFKAAAASRRAAGIKQAHQLKDSDDADWLRFNGHDTRSLTGILLGDPIPNDPRRPWCPWLMTEGSDG